MPWLVEYPLRGYGSVLGRRYGCTAAGLRLGRLSDRTDRRHTDTLTPGTDIVLTNLGRLEQAKPGNYLVLLPNRTVGTE